MNKLPKAVTENIVVQDLRDELLVYNLTMHQAFTLNETLKTVYLRCDGKTTFGELRRAFKFNDDLIHLALTELSANNLLENYAGEHFGNLSRREAIKRVGLASIVALPLITNIVAPSAAHAASFSQANNTICTRVAFGDSSECHSRICVPSYGADNTAALRCCANGDPGVNGSPGYIFLGLTQAYCSNLAALSRCCSGRAVFDVTNNTCVCIA